MMVKHTRNDSFVTEMVTFKKWPTNFLLLVICEVLKLSYFVFAAGRSYAAGNFDVEWIDVENSTVPAGELVLLSVLDFREFRLSDVRNMFLSSAEWSVLTYIGFPANGWYLSDDYFLLQIYDQSERERHCSSATAMTGRWGDPATLH